MSFLGGFKENTDVHEVSADNKPEISQEAHEKFEQVMGDEQLTEAETAPDNIQDSPLPSDKFDGLFDNDEKIFEPDLTEVPVVVDDVEECLSDNSELNLDDWKEKAVDNYRIPKSGGEWSGEPGDSEWSPDSDSVPGDRNGTNPDDKTWKQIKEEYDFEGIPFEDGKPDFSDVSKGDVEIDDFSDNRRKNFVQADEKLAEQKGCTPSEVRQWRTENKYTWHEEMDCKTMKKVPTEVHGNIPHDGGISEMKNQNAEKEGGENNV